MRALRFLLPLIYVLSSLPVQASYHYCLGRVKQISFFEVHDPRCVCPAEEDYGDCCGTEQNVLDFQDDHTAVAKAELSFSAAFILASSGQPPLILLPVESTLCFAGRAPPSRPKQAGLYLQHCNFRL
jgi:hypothetical protein